MTESWFAWLFFAFFVFWVSKGMFLAEASLVFRGLFSKGERSYVGNTGLQYLTTLYRAGIMALLIYMLIHVTGEFTFINYSIVLGVILAAILTQSFPLLPLTRPPDSPNGARFCTVLPAVPLSCCDAAAAAAAAGAAAAAAATSETIRRRTPKHDLSLRATQDQCATCSGIKPITHARTSSGSCTRAPARTHTRARPRAVQTHRHARTHTRARAHTHRHKHTQTH